MITEHDIEAFKDFLLPDVSDYSEWVEGKIITEGETRLIENVLGLVGEAGEVAEKVKKLLRDDSKLDKSDIIKELGDVAFYTAALANYFGSNLNTVLEVNMAKLNDRAQRGVISGSGDSR